MTNQNLTDRLKQYVDSIEKKIGQYRYTDEKESLFDNAPLDGPALILKLQLDKFYEIFPEIKPDGYKTQAKLDKERKERIHKHKV